MIRQKQHRHDVEERHAPNDVTEEISELLAGYALDALSEEDTAFVDLHLASRPAWQWELSSFQRVSQLIAYSSPLQQVPVRARAGILARIDALAIEEQQEAIARSHSGHGLRHHVRRLKSNIPRVAWAAAVPTTIIAVVFIMTSILMQERISEQQTELAQFHQEQVKVNDVLLADNSEQQVVELIQSSVAPLARGRLYIDRTDNAAMLVVRDMPPAAEGQAYVVWMLIGTDHDEYAKLGELRIDDLGRGQIILDPPDDFNHYPVVRITLEDDATVGVPAGPEVMTGGIARTPTSN